MSQPAVRPEAPARDSTQKPALDWRSLLQRYGVFLGLLVMCLILSFLSDVLLTPSNLINVLRQVSVNAIIAAGMTFVILTGGIDLSVGSLLAFAGVLSAGLQSHGFLVAVFVPLLAVAVLGVLSGVVITRGQIAPFVVTLGMMTIARGLTLVYTGGMPISPVAPAFRVLGDGYLWVIPVPIIIMLAVYLLAGLVLRGTAFGRHVYAIGGNEQVARLSGVNTGRVKTAVYAISGLAAALAGLILTARLNSGDPTAGMGYELDAIAAVVIGGTSLNGGEGGVGGTLVGALIIGVLNNGLNLLNVPSFYQQIVKGLIIVGAVLFDRRKRR